MYCLPTHWNSNRNVLTRPGPSRRGLRRRRTALRGRPRPRAALRRHGRHLHRGPALPIAHCSKYRLSSSVMALITSGCGLGPALRRLRPGAVVLHGLDQARKPAGAPPQSTAVPQLLGLSLHGWCFGSAAASCAAQASAAAPAACDRPRSLRAGHPVHPGPRRGVRRRRRPLPRRRGGGRPEPGLLPRLLRRPLRRLTVRLPP